MSTHHVQPRARKAQDVHVKIPVELLEQLDHYRYSHNTTRTLTVCQALQQLLQHQQTTPASWHP